MLTRNRVLIALGAAVVLVALIITARPPARAPAGEAIRICDTSFQSLWINNAIAKLIIEEGYEYPVEILTMTTPVFLQSLRSGQADLHMELWRVNNMDWYNEVTSSGEVIDLGPTYERSTQGFYVPRYVIEGDPERGIAAMAPDLRSVFDLPRYKHVFQDPEDANKGLFVNSMIGWTCTEINRIKLHAYGLLEHYNLIEPGTPAAIDAAIAGAYQRGEPVVAYYWEPTWLVGTFDLVLLEEPEFDEAVWADILRAIGGEIPVEQVKAACAYEEISIHKGIHSSLVDRAPEVVDFLRKMNVGTDPLNATAAYMESNDVEADEAALWYFREYQDRWREWLPEDVETRVEEALRAAGVPL